MAILKEWDFKPVSLELSCQWDNLPKTPCLSLRESYIAWNNPLFFFFFFWAIIWARHILWGGNYSPHWGFVVFTLTFRSMMILSQLIGLVLNCSLSDMNEPLECWARDAGELSSLSLFRPQLWAGTAGWCLIEDFSPCCFSSNSCRSLVLCVRGMTEVGVLLLCDGLFFQMCTSVHNCHSQSSLTVFPRPYPSKDSQYSHF